MTALMRRYDNRVRQRGIMKIAGYVRQTPGRSDPDTAFAQSERIRRWASETANELISVCQDHPTASAPMDRPGFKALLDIARSGGTDAVVIANLAAFSPDKITQEIMIQDLREAGVTVIATDDADIEALGTARDDHARIVVRDVLARMLEYRKAFGLSGDGEVVTRPTLVEPEIMVRDTSTDVIIELIAPTA